MSCDLFNFEEVCQGGFAFGFLFCALHGSREVVDEVGVDLEDHGFGEGGHEHVPDLLLLVPVSDGLRECYAKEGVTVEYFWNSVEQKLNLVVA